MNYLVNSSEMKACDNWTIREMGFPSLVLMERAALATVEVLKESFGRPKRVLVLCGSGNNGGDGFAAARLLLLDGIAADVYFAGKESSLTEETALQKKIFENYGGKLCRNPQMAEYTILVDALFGIGLSRPVSGRCGELIETANRSGRPILAVDMPSGVSADTGEVRGWAIRADVTVTFAFAKLGQLLYPGTEYCGKLVVRDIGITGHCLERKTTAFTYEREDLAGLPVRKPRSNKGSYGRVLLIGGAENMAGAPLLAARAAYRTGCGLVKVFSHGANRNLLQSGLPEALFGSWQQEGGLEEALSWATVVGIGPGMGTSPEAKALVKKVLALWEGPLVADADALNILAEHPEYGAGTRAQIVATPHPGEMARLEKRSTAEILGTLLDTAVSFAEKRGMVCVMKDARTLVSDGKRIYVNHSGNNGMAVGGSGDVLTGVICGLLAQGMEPFAGACMGVYLHGLAGDAAREKLGSRSMLAGDIAEGISEVLRSWAP